MRTLLLVIHGGALAVVTGLLVSIAFSRTRSMADSMSRERVRHRALGAAALLVGPVALSSLLLVRLLPYGMPGLLATRHGRLLLAQEALVAAAVGLLVPLVRATSRPDLRGLRWTLAIELVLALSLLLIVALLASRRSSVGEAIVWPFRFRLAPGVMWQVPAVRHQIFFGTGILGGGLLALVMALRIKGWRPLLLAAGVIGSVAGVYQAVSAMAIDAYPTTYLRPAVEPTPESVRIGQALFLTHCAVCHGPNGRGDGPAASGLVQRPADLTAAHTADHTPGDIFWWVSHGLGLAMPAFADQLSPEERWHVVNFVRALPGRPADSSGSAR